MAQQQQQQQQPATDGNFDPDFYHDLFLNALSSEDPQTALANQGRMGIPQQSSGSPVVLGGVNGLQSSYTKATHASPVQNNPPGSGTLADESPFLDFDVDEPNFDWNVSGEMIPPLPGEDANGDSPHDEQHQHHEGDKRKSPEDAEDDDGGGKRREPEDKTGKKPGRKPLTSEPTSKRKAQNRAAQRAFRERKEKHLKDLEQKVEDLEKASESTNNENSMLRAQVDQLQTQVKEYRKRLSIGGSSYGRSSPTSTQFSQPQSAKSNWDINNNFTFDFPRFGATGGSYTTASPSSSRILLPNEVLETGANGVTVRSISNGASKPKQTPSFSGRSQSGSFQSKDLPPFEPQQVDDYSSLFSPSDVASVSNRSNSIDTQPYSQSNAPLQRSPKAGGEPARNGRKNSSNTNPHLNRAASESNTASPASSGINGGFISSSVTTPESAPDSPKTDRKNSEAAGGFASKEHRRSGSKIGSSDDFCKEFATACGTKNDPVPAMLSHNTPGSSNAAEGTPSSTFAPQTPGSTSEKLGIDWLAQQNGGMFDPVLFADYRDPQDSVMNAGGDFNSFFSDALPLDAKSPGSAANATSMGFSAAAGAITQPLEAALPKKHDLMREVEASQEGREPDQVVPGDEAQQFITCNLLWDRVQRSEKLHSGEFDMDDLCSQLKSKAKCSGSGPVIASKDVDAILGPAPDAGNGPAELDFWKMFK